MEACSACESYYPWMHRLPTEKELEEATSIFLNHFFLNLDEAGAGWANVADLWYLEVYTPGIEESYDVFDLILCFKIEPAIYNDTISEYYFTSLEYDSEKGYFFNANPGGAFNSRSELNHYLEAYVVRMPLSAEHIRLKEWAGPDFAVLGQKEAGIEKSQLFLIFAAFIALSTVFIALAIRSFRKRKYYGEAKGR